jgi:ribosome-binding protein aMBF1 (putative translation factor)
MKLVNCEVCGMAKPHTLENFMRHTLVCRECNKEVHRKKKRESYQRQKQAKARTQVYEKQDAQYHGRNYRVKEELTETGTRKVTFGTQWKPPKREIRVPHMMGYKSGIDI